MAKDVEHIGFALYGLSPPTRSIGDFYGWSLDWFRRFHCVPDIADADVNGKTNGNYKQFQTLDRKARKAGFRGITQWSMIDVPEEYSTTLPGGQLNGVSMGITYSTLPFARGFVFHLRVAIVGNRDDEVLCAARQASEILQPRYGFVFSRPFFYGPESYGLGMRQNGNFAQDDGNMDHWRYLERHDAFTLLRSVYPYSFLTQTQLDIKVGSVRLEDWINADPAHGSLGPFTDEMKLWTVPEDRIRPVRDELWNAGVVLDRKRHFEDVMNEYHIDENVVAEHYKTGKPLVKRPRGPGLTREQMLSGIVEAFGGPDSEVLQKDESGKLRSVKVKPSKPGKRKPKS